MAEFWKNIVSRKYLCHVKIYSFEDWIPWKSVNHECNLWCRNGESIGCSFCNKLVKPSDEAENHISRIYEAISHYSKSIELRNSVRSTLKGLVELIITVFKNIGPNNVHNQCITLVSITFDMDELIRNIAVWFLTHKKYGVQFCVSGFTCDDKCGCKPEEDYMDNTELVNFILLQFYACLRIGALLREHKLKYPEALELFTALSKSETLTIGEIIITSSVFPDACEGFKAFCKDITTKKNACLQEIAEAKRILEAEAEAKLIAEAKAQRVLEEKQISQNVRSFLKNM